MFESVKHNSFIIIYFIFRHIKDEILHQRGTQKKHEADQQKDKIKKIIAYMEAVCYFCLCAISQYRINQTKIQQTNTSAASSNKTSIDLLNQTYSLLKLV